MFTAALGWGEREVICRGEVANWDFCCHAGFFLLVDGEWGRMSDEGRGVLWGR